MYKVLNNAQKHRALRPVVLMFWEIIDSLLFLKKDSLARNRVNKVKRKLYFCAFCTGM